MIYPDKLREIYDELEKIFRKEGYIAGNSGRHMKFPYTISAKIAQFPYFYYMKNNNIWMYYPVSFILSFFVFVKIHRLANSDANKKSWAEIQRRNAKSEHH